MRIIRMNRIFRIRMANPNRNPAQGDKHRVEILLPEDMRHNLTEAQEERTILGENLAEAQTQIKELMQLNTTQGSGGLARRQSLAPSMATFHTADMTNISFDADDSVGAMGTSNLMEEDLGDVAKQQWEDRLKSVEVERKRVEAELAMEKEDKEILDRDLQAGEEKIKQLIVEKERVEDTLRNVQETKDAQDTSFEALKTRTSHLSSERVAAMEKARLLEGNNTRLQEEMDKVVEEKEERGLEIELLETEKEEIMRVKSVLEAEALENKAKFLKVSQEKETLKKKMARLEKELRTEMEAKNSLAQSFSQLTTETNAMKNQLRQEQANKEKQKEVDAALEKEKEVLKDQLMQAQARTEELQSKVEAGALLESKLAKVQEELTAYETKCNSMQAELATSEIKNAEEKRRRHSELSSG